MFSFEYVLIRNNEQLINRQKLVTIVTIEGIKINPNAKEVISKLKKNNIRINDCEINDTFININNITSLNLDQKVLAAANYKL